ncbi:MAG: hypothetical protein A2Y15_00380 [Clostridiales bacterium GWF2_36_10]|nr:MAG: hypothetical protein A2Y15_00380 [Clostridiales bacterium GWF2_36_10]HAN21754.1 50S ribosomal protein L7 [Clostridiales bacterium]
MVAFVKKLLGVLGLANKAGALEVGTNNVLNSIKNEKAKLVILAADISENTKKLLTDKANYRNIKMLSLPVSMEEFAHVLGKKSTSSAAITNDNFITALNKQLPDNPSD